ncbi:hypothetical protein PR202_gb07793 [Eleusine coracana subsp. coracana]|uniref:Formin-like protein n=1 Tax=Eleusine coracana subsp. coracana TaxID=191504 RepID=A0AAV5ECC1_ELECO|nr:hypothetical protein PR202_gb07793 [Eleusine coracana subsp. coracana]
MPLLVTLSTLLLFLPASAGDVRRALHEPLFPIEWTPPPSTTAPPGPGFTADPSTPVPPDNGGPALLPPPPPPPPNTVTADASSSGTGPAPRLHGGGGGTPKAAIVVASAAAAAVLALLAFAAAFFLTGRLARQHHTLKPPSDAVAARPDASVAGNRKVRTGGRVMGMSMCRDVDTVPSPELRPLPPLMRRGGSSTDEDAAYYTPGQRSAGGGGTWSEASASSPRTTTPSRRSLPSLTSDFFPATPAAAAAPAAPPAPRSRRTLPRTRFSAGSASDMVKEMVAPPTTYQSGPPPPPPPPPPPSSSARTFIKTEGPSSIAMTRTPMVAPLMRDNNDSSTGVPARTPEDDARPKLKPLHWDKVRACPDRDMVWDRLKSNSFQLDEDMIEVLFPNNTANAPSAPRDNTPRKAGVPPQCTQEKVLDPKKAQNIAILLRALNVTAEEVSDALLCGNKLCSYNAACDDLKGSRLFLKLLEAVLRTGNRMNVGTNRGQAKAFKLDSLLKLADVKGTDGKTTLLHFVAQEIVRSEDAKFDKAAENQTRNIVKDQQFRNNKHGLNVVSGLSNEIGNVKKAASMDFDVLHGYVSKLEGGLGKIKSVLQLEKQCTQGQKFFTTMHDS